ncbi:MAG: FG-GAP-like repeat-containing protein [Bryobacteraceae bacterium]|nr:FG-GAP-like repeat-containing protein [Bryobacteraceae bacterium]
MGLFFCSTAAAQTVTSITLSVSPGPSLLGEPVTLTAAVAPSGAAGKVTFYDGATFLGVRSLTGGTAAFLTAQLPAGNRNLRAYYSGSASFAPSLSSNVQHQVSSAPSLALKPAVDYPVSNPWSVAAGDFNSDLRPDVAVSSGATIRLFLGKGDGSFDAPLTLNIPGSRLAVADFDGDGHLDIASAGAETLAVALGNGNGTFQPAIESAADQYSRLLTGDFNGDGKADLAGLGFSSAIFVRLGNGDGTFAPPAVYATASSPGSLAAADFNGDTRVDLVVTCPAANQLLVFIGNGDGTFPVPQTLNRSLPGPVAAGDLNADGKADLVIGSAGNPPVLSSALGNGDGTFQAANFLTTLISPSSVSLGDVNGDGRVDVVLATDYVFGSGVHYGNGDGTFQTATPFSSHAAQAAVVGELNGDFKTDVVLLAASPQVLSVHLGGAIVDLAVEMSTGGLLTQGQAGAFYKVSVSNVGSLPTSGAVGVAASLPAAITATSISGAGWTCVLTSLSCARSDPLAGGESYAPIHIVFNVPSNLSGNITASVTAAVAGDGNATNNVAVYTAQVRFAGTTSLISSPNPSQVGQSVTLTATVSSGAGSVAYYDGNTILGFRALAGNHAVLTSRLLTPGSHTIWALHMGDASTGPSTSGSVIQIVHAVPANGLRPAVSYSGGSFVAGGDFNQDGKPDLITQNGDVLLGRGDGSFQVTLGYLPPPAFSTRGATAGDFNGDGKTDVVLAGDSIFVYLGKRKRNVPERPACAAKCGRGPRSGCR